MPAWARPVPEGLQIFVRLTPGSNRDAVEGTEKGADGRVYLKVRVRAIAEKGKANRALIALLATRSDVAKSRIEIVSGQTSRLKSLFLQGDSDAMLEAVAKLEQ